MWPETFLFCPLYKTTVCVYTFPASFSCGWGSCAIEMSLIIIINVDTFHLSSFCYCIICLLLAEVVCPESLCMFCVD